MACTSTWGTDAGPGWNDSIALDLVTRAIAARRHAWADSSLRSFGAYAEGHVTYLAEFGTGGEQAVRADQIALQVRWQKDRGSLQTLVGRRETSWMPSRIRYHVDHLSLFLENFGDRISVGEGDEVRDVRHPVSAAGSAFYEQRLVDSLSLRINETWTRVYRIEVRPRCPDDPGLVGILDIDRETHAIARIAAGFTRASYVDPTVTGVSLELENALVDGRYWLPAAQRVEIRRQVRWLELPFAGTIRTDYRILEYDLRTALQPPVRRGDLVVSLAQPELERYAGWRLEEMSRPGAPTKADSARFEAIRRRAVEVAAGRYLEGSSRLRAWMPDVSSGVRYRRAEGLLLGAGVTYALDGTRSVSGWGGYAFGRQRPEWLLAVSQQVGPASVRLSGFLNRQADVGPMVAEAGIISTVDAAFRGDDWLDPYWTDGAWLTVEGAVWQGVGLIRVAYERHASAALEGLPVGGVEPRPVREIRSGTDLRAELQLDRPLGPALGASWEAHLTSQLSGGGDFGYTRWVAGLVARPVTPRAAWRWEGAAAAGLSTGTTPEQRVFLLGGRGTVPGFAFRAWGGDRMAYGTAAVTRSVAYPWVGLRGLASCGWTELTAVGREAAERLRVAESGGLQASLGGGLSLFWDVLRFDVAHGLGDGEWEWMLSVNPAWRAPL